MPHGLPIFAKVHPDDIRLVLPAPGDPRGLPGPGELTGAAHAGRRGRDDARRSAWCPRCARHTSGSGVEFETVLWRVFPVADYRPGLPDGRRRGRGRADPALGEATTQLTKLDVAQWKPELAGALQALRRPDSTATLPAGFDPRARRLFARASVLDQMLALAETSAPGGAVNGYEAQQRDAALRPLTTACRQALVAACNSPLHA